MMTGVQASWLLAQADSYSHMSRRFQAGGHSISLLEIGVWLLLIVGAVGFAWCTCQLYSRMIKAQKRSPVWLFRELCAAHGLTWADRQLLQWLARTHDIAHASHLFLRPNVFDPATLPPHMAAWKDRVEQLREKLFSVASC